MLIYHYSGRFYDEANVNGHSHRGIELVLVTQGECLSACGGKTDRGRPGTLFVIAPETVHTQQNMEKVETFYTVFTADKAIFDRHNRAIDTSGDPFIEPWMRNMYSLYDAMDNDECHYLLRALLRRLQRLEKQAVVSQNMPPPLFKAIRYIENRFNGPLDQEMIASHSGIGVSRLKTLFHENFQVPPMTYVTRLRMSYARQMLQDSYLSIGEVASRCGYEDQNYFARAFRKHHGLPPSTFRQEHPCGRENP